MKLPTPKILHGRGKNCIVAGSNTTVPIARASCKQRKKFLCQIRIGKLTQILLPCWNANISTTKRTIIFLESCLFFFSDSPSHCFEYGVSYRYSPLPGDTNVTNPLDCQRKCVLTTKCKYFIFTINVISKVNKCRMIENKSKDASKAKLVVFGPKYCKGIMQPI